MSVSLSDAELAVVMDAARPLSPKARHAFLIDIARELAKRHEFGPGSIHRLVREMQRRHFTPPPFADSLSAPRAGRVR
jgi:hypothetical protein